jgi:aspartyl-tRNA(Asn)/glutamyl-tRNA(Gln) amidotransferase subunit A
MKTLEALALELEQGKTSAAELVDVALARIKDPAGEGRRAFILLDEEAAREGARHMDVLRRRNAQPSRYAGIPISVKDLFDMTGQVTTAGSIVLKDSPPAKADAPAIARLKAQGLIVLGRTNMTEFAYSGLGLNPHYGTPLSPFERARRRIPGGSSSGAAVSVADGMCALAIGTDTGGSCRIPAAFCGVVGFKPSTGRIPTEGAYPLSYTLDSVGSLGNSVRCVATGDALMAGQEDQRLVEVPPSRIRLGIPQSLERMDTEHSVAKAFERAVKRISEAGVAIETAEFPSIEEIAQINTKGGISAVEAFSHHKELIAAAGDRYDPRVCRRIANGASIAAHEYVDTLRKRARLIEKVKTMMAGLDAAILPTTPNIPPLVSALETDDEYLRLNFLSLRNTFIGNFLNMCAISLPVHEPEEPPVGFMAMAPSGSDRHLLSVALALEGLLRRC